MRTPEDVTKSINSTTDKETFLEVAEAIMREYSALSDEAAAANHVALLDAIYDSRERLEWYYFEKTAEMTAICNTLDMQALLDEMARTGFLADVPDDRVVGTAIDRLDAIWVTDGSFITGTAIDEAKVQRGS